MSDTSKTLLYRRLLFEIKILRKELENIVKNDLEVLNLMKQNLTKIQNKFFAISKDLIPAK